MLNDSLGKVYDAFKDEESYLKLYLGIYIIYLFLVREWVGTMTPLCLKFKYTHLTTSNPGHNKLEGTRFTLLTSYKSIQNI